jgi:hypothetical protein
MPAYDANDPTSPLITLSVVDVPISAEARCDGTEIHLLLGGATVILLAEQAAAVADALDGVASR